MEEYYLIKFVGLVAMFVAMSILSVGSLALSNAIAIKAFEPAGAASPSGGSKEPPYRYMTDSAGNLRASIQNYSSKLLRYYGLVSFFILLVAFIPVIAAALGGGQSADGYIHFGKHGGFTSLFKYYPSVCLAVTIGYSFGIVYRVASFKRLFLRMIDE